MNFMLLEAAINSALQEDIGAGDITTEAIVPAGTWAAAEIQSRDHGVLAGLPVAAAVFRRVDPSLELQMSVHDGQKVSAGDVVATIAGHARSILIAERTALNFLQRLSGIATTAAAYAAACSGTAARIVDTRKTAPGLRLLDKYAVRIGGAHNHRVGLFDGVLIKENHIRAGGGIREAVEAARSMAPHTLRIEIECENLEQVRQSLDAGADIILLDNMSTQEMTEAVGLIDGRALVEASGSMTLERIPEVAAAGVDLISVGALTHSVRALDLSLEIVEWHLPGQSPT